MTSLLVGRRWLPEAASELLPTVAGSSRRRRRLTTKSACVAAVLLLLALAASTLDSRVPSRTTSGSLPSGGARCDSGPLAFVDLRHRSKAAAAHASEVGQTPADAEDEAQDEETAGQEVRRLLNGAVVELEEMDSAPWRTSKLLVPLVPEVARWWADPNTDISVKLSPCDAHGDRHLHVQVYGEDRMSLDLGVESADGIHAVVQLPHEADYQDCRVEWAWMDARDVEPLMGLGPVRALRVTCPVRYLAASLTTSNARAALDGLLVRMLLRWLLLPWPLLLMPLFMMSIVRPMVLAGSMVFAHFLHIARRRRRLWRVKAWFRRAPCIDGAFGEGDPCCICLADPSEEEELVALLPCRHTLHIDCYSGWVCTDTYPSPDLICPLCRKTVHGVGRLEPVTRNPRMCN